MLISLAVRQTLHSKLLRYGRTPLQANWSGADVAARMLRAYGIADVSILHTPGQLTDHYDPRKKTVNLSEQVYYGRNAAAAAIAAHECGHALQHAQGYPFLRFRTAMVPALSATTHFMPWVVLVGIMLVNLTPLPLQVGIGLFSLTTLFSLITLPVEFDASRRALAWIVQGGVVTKREHRMAREALRWAAMTYVVAALGSLAQLLRLVMILHHRRERA